MFGPIGFPELMMIFLVVIILFGPKKLPDFAKFLGKAIREFRKTVNDAKNTIEDELADSEIGEDLKGIDRDIKDLKASTRIDLNTSPSPRKRRPSSGKKG